MATATVLITLLNDARVARTLESLARQTRPADAILVADGGSREETLRLVREFAAQHPNARLESHPGSVAETRNSALASVSTDVVVFLDADQVAPDAWLAALLAPIEAGEADFTGGPTQPLQEAATPAERYVNDYEKWFYDNVVSSDITMLPMGNSAWRMDVFQDIGPFDRALVWGGEDYDVNLRAARAGFRGVFVPGAWVYHDQRHLDSARKILRRKYRYAVGATVAYLKNGTLFRKIPGAAATGARFRHRYEWMNVLVKPFALARGLIAWRRIRRQSAR